ncbi:acyl CoA:acetate/3-ketoacid CoA transferase [Thermoplasma acidophilum]|nr:acyl CoA:acetate/3-ketoacid CoA transferase [Thermoplasma acidophilum]
MMERKFANPEEVFADIKDGSVIASSGFNRAMAPEYLLEKLYDHYRETGHPKHLFFEFETTTGMPGIGTDKVAKQIYESGDTEFIDGMLIPFTGFSPWSAKLIQENIVEGYMWAIGVAANWFREVAAGRPGLLTKVGLGIFMDPRDPDFQGGLMNERARSRRRANVSLVHIDGEEYLLYRAPQPDVAFIRGTTSDEQGNISVEEEGAVTSVLSIAQAAKVRHRGTVIAQVKRITKCCSRPAKSIEVPGPLVDYVIKAPREVQWQTGSYEYHPAISGEDYIPDLNEILMESAKNMSPIEYVIARRAAIELTDLMTKYGRTLVINLGIGIPVYTSIVLNQEGLQNYVIGTVEPGAWGGVSLAGNDFGVAISPSALIRMPDQFANYEGSIIDAAVLGFMQVDPAGNVNASYLPGSVFTGPGGFPVIARGAPNLIFAGRFTAGKTDEYIRDGRIFVNRTDSEKIKFVRKIALKVFSASEAMKQGQNVTYITERGVFRLTSDGLLLTEVAPGIDIDRDILGMMEYEVRISDDLREMDPAIFDISSRMNLRSRVISEVTENVPINGE